MSGSPVAGVRVSYPPELPISARRDELIAAISDHQLVVVAGETGSGKSTQLPKLCLDAGRGRSGVIGHTQPRRIAARSVAERIAEELETDLGDVVGYKVRFTDQVSGNSRIKLMTDGILLAEMSRDRTLEAYDTIIIDEAHERSLNIDFLLGYLHQLLPRRPDLKVVITSATIDTDKFADHFGGAPIIEVSGRTYPVEIRYRPLDDEESGYSLEQPEGIVEAAKELVREEPGDILVFCSGERQITEAADALGKARLPQTSVLPLFARLSAADQHKVFEPHQGRRIVVATNVAETSLTVPGVRYVIDTGTARISRYSNRTKVQRLPIEAVSQASADQRAGRCGRLGPGVAIRLFSEDDYDERPEFTDPEIQRTNLASVILQMADLRLGEAEDFPFVDPPDPRQIADGIRLLEELGAVDPEHRGTVRWLTAMGRDIARMAVDPRLARMVIAAHENSCLEEVMVIAAGMSIIDPRERPREKQGAADEHHARFADDRSDFLTLLNLWEYLEDQREKRSRNQFVKMCRREFLNANRVREWRDILGQLRRNAKSMGMTPSHGERDPERIHRSILTGLVSQIGMRQGDSQEYRGPRNVRFVVAPGSVQHKGSAGWVMAGELVETHRLFARMVAPIKPEWVEEVAPDLVTYSYGEPWWDAKRGAAINVERVALHGLPLVVDRRVQVSRVDPSMAREMLIHHGLIEGEWHQSYDFLTHNAQVLDEVHALGARARRHDATVDYQRLFAFYDERVDPSATSVQQFDHWWNRERHAKPTLLNMRVGDVTDISDDDIDSDAFPDRVQLGGLDAELTYAFDPTTEADGVTVSVPVAQLNQATRARFDWNVPGLRTELVTELIRTLPKPLRKEFVPVPETVDRIIGRLDPARGALVEVVAHELTTDAGTPVNPASFDLDRLPPHLRPTFRIVADDGETLATGTDLEELATLLDTEVRAAVASADDDGLTVSGLTGWSIGDLPRQVERTASGHTVVAYPSLVDDGASVSVQLLASLGEQRASMRRATRRLLALGLPNPAKALDRLVDNELMLAFARSPYESKAEWADDVFTATIDHLMVEAGGPAWTAAEFDHLRDHVRQGLAKDLWEVANTAKALVLRHSLLRRRLADLTAPGLATSVTDIDSHLSRLVYPRFLTGVGVSRLADLDRYLRAIALRMTKLTDRTLADLEHITKCVPLENEFAALASGLRWSPEIDEITWMLEELRVQRFAQSLKTGTKVSEKRIRAAMAKLTAH